MTEPYDLDQRWLKCLPCHDSGFRLVFRPEPFQAIVDGQEIDRKYLQRPCAVACNCDAGQKKSDADCKRPLPVFDQRRMIEWNVNLTMEQRTEMVELFVKKMKPIKPTGYFDCFSSADSTVYAE